MRRIENLDKWLLGTVCFTIIAVVVINFITSYGHIYVEGTRYGEYGVDARLMPVGIDGMLLALGLANVFAARFNRGHWLLRCALGFGVAGTVAANGAYGATWGLTGGLLATWSPVALFISVEAALFMFRVVADVQQQAVKVTSAKAKGSRGPYKPRAPKPSRDTLFPQSDNLPVIRGRVSHLDPFQQLRDDNYSQTG